MPSINVVAGVPNTATNLSGVRAFNDGNAGHFPSPINAYSAVALSSQAQPAIAVKQAQALRPTGQGQLAQILKTASHTIGAAQPAAAQVLRAFLRTIAAGQAQVASLVKQVSVIRTASQASVPQLVKIASRTIRASQAGAALAVGAKAWLRTMAALQGQTANLVKQVQTMRTTLQGQGISLVKQVSAMRFAIQAPAAQLVKAASMTIRAIQMATGLSASVKALQRLIAAEQGQFVATVRQVNASRIATQAQAGIAGKAVLVRRLVAQAVSLLGTPVRLAGGALLRTITATQAQALQLVKQVQSGRLVAQGQSAGLMKQVQSVRLAAQASVVLIARQVNATRLALQASAASISKLISKVLATVQHAVATALGLVPPPTRLDLFSVPISFTTTSSQAIAVTTSTSLAVSF